MQVTQKTYWQCPKCGSIFEKDEARAWLASLSVGVMGGRTCGNCGNRVESSDIYKGVYDLEAPDELIKRAIANPEGIRIEPKTGNRFYDGQLLCHGKRNPSQRTLMSIFKRLFRGGSSKEDSVVSPNDELLAALKNVREVEAYKFTGPPKGIPTVVLKNHVKNPDDFQGAEFRLNFIFLPKKGILLLILNFPRLPRSDNGFTFPLMPSLDLHRPWVESLLTQDYLKVRAPAAVQPSIDYQVCSVSISNIHGKDKLRKILQHV